MRTKYNEGRKGRRLWAGITAIAGLWRPAGLWSRNSRAHISSVIPRYGVSICLSAETGSEELLAEVGSHCSTVVICRASPSQKVCLLCRAVHRVSRRCRRCAAVVLHHDDNCLNCNHSGAPQCCCSLVATQLAAAHAACIAACTRHQWSHHIHARQ